MLLLNSFLIANIPLFYRQLFLASLVLLPLLGGTWVFGLLSVTPTTSVFAWIFTILNSLQVSAGCAVVLLSMQQLHSAQSS